MEMNFIPKSLEPNFEGYVKVKLLGFIESTKLLKEFKIKINKNGEMDLGGERDQIDILIDSATRLKDYVLEVNITNKETKKEYKSIDDLNFSPECKDIMIELATSLIQGFVVGKN
jgi:methylaspartate ammonia-lyase